MPGEIPIGDDSHLPEASESGQFHSNVEEQMPPDNDGITSRTKFYMDSLLRHVGLRRRHSERSRDRRAGGIVVHHAGWREEARKNAFKTARKNFPWDSPPLRYRAIVNGGDY
jgi:hypothetical protein